jgi:hypothetical protein
MTAFADWPVRPRANHGESLAGYVYRLHSDNGHRLSPSVYQLLKACYCAAEPTSDFDEVDTMLGSEPFGKDVDLMVWNLAWRSFWRSIELYLVAGQPRRTGLQVCPRCLRELRFHLRFWELPLVRACPVHGCVLLTHCKRCGQALNWYAMTMDWKHRCGHSLLEELPVEAAFSDIGIADWLSRAIDAPPCGPAPKGNRLHSQISMTLRMQYRQLAEFEQIRQLVIDQLFPIFTRAVHRESGATKRRRGPHLWELRLVLAGPTGLRNVLRRWARRYLRQMDRDDVPQPVLLRLPDAEAQALVKLTETRSSLREPLSSLLNEYALQTPFESHVLFNPRIAEADKVRLLQQFRRWWLVICLRVRSQQGNGADGDAMMIWSSDDDRREEDAFETLNAVLRISSLNPDIGPGVTVFAPLVTERTWCPSDSGEGLLLRMAAQLMAVPDQVLKRLALESQAMVAELEAHSR